MLLRTARLVPLFVLPLSCYAITGCSGDDSNALSGGTDASTDVTIGSSSGVADSGNDAGPPDAGPVIDEDAAAFCDNAPTLHSAGNAGPFCPFIDGGSSASCQANATCCVNEGTGGLDSYCLATGTCPTTVETYFECSGPSNCNIAAPPVDAGFDDGGLDDGGDAGAVDAAPPAPMFCCGRGEKPEIEGACPAYDLTSDLKATVCAPSCERPDGGAGLIICDSTSGNECPAGTTCTPFRTRGSQLGFCQ